MGSSLDYTDFFDIQRAEPAVMEQIRSDFVGPLIELLRRVGARPGASDRLARQLWSLMIEPGRHYHTPVHVLGMLGWAERLGVKLNDAERLAIWFHDAIFDIPAPHGQNEAASAVWMRWAVVNAGVENKLARHVAEAIRWTDRHLVKDVPPEFRRVMDMDLASMAAPPDVFRRQSEAVQAEMAHLPPEQYQRGTIEFFKGLLSRERIYRSESLASLEPIARRNLQREIERLSALLGNQPT